MNIIPLGRGKPRCGNLGKVLPVPFSNGHYSVKLTHAEVKIEFTKDEIDAIMAGIREAETGTPF